MPVIKNWTCAGQMTFFFHTVVVDSKAQNIFILQTVPNLQF